MGRLGQDGGGFAGIWSRARYRAFRAALLSDRANLEGCRTCPRNDARVQSTLDRMRSLLPQAGRHTR